MLPKRLPGFVRARLDVPLRPSRQRRPNSLATVVQLGRGSSRAKLLSFPIRDRGALRESASVIAFFIFCRSPARRRLLTAKRPDRIVCWDMACFPLRAPRAYLAKLFGPASGELSEVACRRGVERAGFCSSSASRGRDCRPVRLARPSPAPP